MSNGKTKIKVHDGLTGEELRPGAHRGAFEGPILLEVGASSVEVALNDCLTSTNDWLRALRRLLQFPEVAVRHPKGRFPKQCDVDKVSDNTFRFVVRAADVAAAKLRGRKTDDAALIVAARMFHQYRRGLYLVDKVRDCAPGIFLADQWVECDYVVRSTRSTTAARLNALEQWQAALDKFAVLLASPSARP